MGQISIHCKYGVLIYDMTILSHVLDTVQILSILALICPITCHVFDLNAWYLERRWMDFSLNMCTLLEFRNVFNSKSWFERTTMPAVACPRQVNYPKKLRKERVKLFSPDSCLQEPSFQNKRYGILNFCFKFKMAAKNQNGGQNVAMVNISAAISPIMIIFQRL